MKTPARARSKSGIDAEALRLARHWLHENDAWTLDRQVELTEIPAPPFREDVRGRWMADRFAELGLLDGFTDEAGNVVARVPGPSEGAPLIVSAHLDTVFGPEVDVSVTRDGEELKGPGIADDGRGLAALLALAAAIRASELAFPIPVLFVATVGEEGIGDLRGVKHLFREGGPGDGAAGFISLDGAGIRRLVTSGIGSSRFRVTVEGRGGHSWVDHGTPNPLHALGQAIAEWSRMEFRGPGTTTLTVARTGGGTAINAIPQEAWAEVDLRSTHPRSLADARERVFTALEDALVTGSEGAREDAILRATVDILGERPAGVTQPKNALLEAARAATRAVGSRPVDVASSTDANVPMALGIPAVTLGAGGDAGLAHTPQEWYRNTRGPEGIERALLTIANFTRAASVSR